MANRKIDDQDDHRVVRAEQLLGSSLPFQRWDDALTSLLRICGDHGSPDIGNAICVHGQVAGTRSASIVAIDDSHRICYLHASGAPCETPFGPVAAIDELWGGG